MPLADQLCQVSHVCVKAGRKFLIDQDTCMVMLQVPDEDALIELATKIANHATIDCVSFEEPDLDNTMTAICTNAISGIDRMQFIDYDLWRE